MEAVMPVDFSKSGAYLMSASVSGPATASPLTTLLDEPVGGVAPLEQVVASNAIAGNRDNSLTPIPNLIGLPPLKTRDRLESSARSEATPGSADGASFCSNCPGCPACNPSALAT